MWRNLFILYYVFVKKQRTIERKKKRSKISALESCYANRIYVLIGVELRPYGQKLVQFCKHTHTRVSFSSIDDVLVSSSRRADDITRERRRESLGWIPHNRTSMIVSYTPAVSQRSWYSVLCVNAGGCGSSANQCTAHV